MGISVFVVDRERTFADAVAARLEAEEDVGVVAAVHARTPAQCFIVGRHADVVLLDAPDDRHLLYHWGMNLVSAVVRSGAIVRQRFS